MKAIATSICVPAAVALVLLCSGNPAQAADSSHAKDIWARAAELAQAAVANGAKPEASPQVSMSEARDCDDCPRIITFAPLGAAFTEPFAINADGVVTGYFGTADGTLRSFLREPDGKITVFDAPGAGQGIGFGTIAWSISPSGEIAGNYRGPDGIVHSFVRSRDGAFTTFDAPGAGTNGSDIQGTFAFNINADGSTAGQYVDNANVSHGFVRDRDGEIIGFDISGAGTGVGQGTATASIDGLNPEGAVTGWYVDSGNVDHAYVRSPDGDITTFDIADAGTGQFQGTTPGGINAKGETEGSYLDDNNVYHGYLRTREGQITIVNIPGAGDSPTQNYPHEGTIVANINEGGDVTGAYFDANLVSHAFIRYRDGRIETFDAPDAGTAVGQGTYPQCNNARNAITGYYFDANGVLRGFVRTPGGE